MVINLGLFIGILIFAFIVTSVLIVPFIDLLYRLKLTHHYHLESTFKEEQNVFSSLISTQKSKLGTPIGGGILIVFSVTLLFTLSYLVLPRLGFVVSHLYPILDEINILFFTFISFALLGLYEDILKIFNLAKTNHRIKPFRKTTMLILLSGLISLMLFLNLHIDIIHLPMFGTLELGIWFIPISTLVISFFSKAYDITDGMDGLASGILLIALVAFWAVSLSVLDSVLSIFIALWVGALLAFLYFNIYPARIWLGNSGSLSFGATLAVLAILLGKTAVLFIIGLVFVIEALSQLIQVIFVTLRKRPIFPVTPLHYWLQQIGWPEPKVVMRTWILTLVGAVFGLWLTGI